MSNLSKMFGGLVDFSKLDLEQSPVIDLQRRKFVFFDFVGERAFTGESSGFLGEINIGDWFLESLYPVPLLSNAKNGDFNVILNCLAPVKSNVRILCFDAVVEFGNVGKGSRLHFGSHGRVVGEYLEVFISLREQGGWIQEDLSDEVMAGKTGAVLNVKGFNFFEFII